MTAMKPIPQSITTAAMIRPSTRLGVTSPYPTIVTVCGANHSPLLTVGNS